MPTPSILVLPAGLYRIDAITAGTEEGTPRTMLFA